MWESLTPMQWFLITEWNLFEELFALSDTFKAHFNCFAIMKKKNFSNSLNENLKIYKVKFIFLLLAWKSPKVGICYKNCTVNHDNASERSFKVKNKVLQSNIST